MSQYATADEEVAQLKSIIKEYGPALLLGLVVALGGSFGYKAWQSSQQQTREQASAIYTQIVNLNLAQQPGQALDDGQRGSLIALTDKLKQDYSDSSYAAYAALFAAKQAMAAAEPAVAETELNWVLSQQQDADLADLARVRLARVLLDQGEARYAEAAQLLAGVQGDAFKLGALAAQGDLALAQQDIEAARSAYAQALDLARQQGTSLPLVQLKLDDLARASDEV